MVTLFIIYHDPQPLQKNIFWLCLVVNGDIMAVFSIWVYAKRDICPIDSHLMHVKEIPHFSWFVCEKDHVQLCLPNPAQWNFYALMRGFPYIVSDSYSHAWRFIIWIVRSPKRYCIIIVFKDYGIMFKHYNISVALTRSPRSGRRWVRTTKIIYPRLFVILGGTEAIVRRMTRRWRERAKLRFFRISAEFLYFKDYYSEWVVFRQKY